VRSAEEHDEAEEAEYLELLEGAIRTLPSEDRPPATMYYRDGYSVNEISKSLGTPYQ
jgi:DNA-directed RNA polymerase specialized sigma24 family protein